MGKELHIFNYYCAVHYYDDYFCNDWVRGPMTEQYKEVFSNTDYLWFPLNFSEFYLPRNTSREEIIKAVYSRPAAESKRDYYIKAHRRVENLSSSHDYLDFMLKLVSIDYAKYERVFFWLEQSASSHLVMRFLCTFINAPMSLVDVSHFPTEPNGTEVKTFSGLSRSNFNQNWLSVRDKAVPIDSNMKLQYSQEWVKWCRSKYAIRVLERGTIIGKNPDFLDDEIIKSVRQAMSWWTVLSRVERKVSYKDFTGMNGWGFISERLRALCETKKVHAYFAESGETGSLFGSDCE